MYRKITHFLNQTYPSTIDTLSNISKDDDGNIVSYSSCNAFNFDTIATDVFFSSDALIVDIVKDRLCFIEFKNVPFASKKGSSKKILKYEIKQKAIESILALGSVLIQNSIISNLSELISSKFEFILVYSASKNTNNRGNTRLRTRLYVNSYFNLDRYEGIIFDKISIVSNTLFDNTFFTN